MMGLARFVLSLLILVALCLTLPTMAEDRIAPAFLAFGIGLLPAIRADRHLLHRWMTIALAIGILTAAGCTAWMLASTGEEQEAAYLLAAGLSMPLGQLAAFMFPGSSQSPNDLAFTLTLPILNAVFMAAFFAGWHSLLMSNSRLYRSIGAPPNEELKPTAPPSSLVE